MPEPKLKPCPFCGCTEISASGSLDLPECYACGATGPDNTIRENAGAFWNRRASAWQPIETAPKDGTRVLLTDGSAVTIGDWDGDPKHFWAGEGPGWWTGGCFPGPWTHWAPLPALPGKAGG